MRLRVLALSVCGVAAVMYLLAIVVHTAQVTVESGAVAFAALAWYVVLARRTLPSPVRWPLLAGLLTLGLAFVVWALSDTAGETHEYGFFAYQPLQAMPVTVLRTFGHGLRGVAVPLIAYGCLAFAVLRLPRRRRPPLLVAGLVAMLIPLGWVAVQYANQPASKFHAPATLAEVLAVLGPPLLVVLLALGAATLAGQRIGATLIVAGFVLTALAGVYALDLSRYALVFAIDIPEPTGPVLIATAVASGTSLSGVEPIGPLATLLPAAAQLAGALLLTIGCVRAASAAQPEEAVA